MVNAAKRNSNYLAQTGRSDLTPRQRRRWDHKVGHQSIAARDRRAARSSR